MSTPSLSPCLCCGPSALNPKGAFVTVSGVKNKPYPDCEECPNFNGTFVIVFPVEGCNFAAPVSFCGSNAYVDLGLGGDPDHSCRMKYFVQLNGNAGGAGIAYFSRGNLTCCYQPVTLSLDSALNEVCDFTEAIVVVTPFGEWTQEEISNARCIPQLTKTCPNTYPVLIPGFSDLSQELDSTCSSCKCSSPGPQPGIPGATSCPTCSAGQTASPINGNLSIALSTPSSGSLAPTERLYFNSAPVFGPNSPYADTQMQSPPAGSNVSGLHGIRLIDKAASTEANVIRCDGSIDLYRCKDSTTRIYEPRGNRNSLVENVNGSGVRTGWTEITQPDRFRYEYNDTGVLKYIQNPAGQRWTMVRSSGSLASIVDPLTRRTSFTYASSKLSRVQDVYGRITSLTVDANGNLTRFITPTLCTTELRYGTGYASAHQLIALIDSSGVRTSYTYDAYGWIASVTAPSGGVTQYSYADWLNAKVIDPLGRVTTIVFDEARNIKTVTNPGMSPFSAKSDCTKALRVIQPSGSITSFVYESGSSASPRLTATANQDGRTTWIYSSGNTTFQPSASVDALGNRTTCIWNAAGQKTASINPLNQRTSFLYDSSSRIVATISPLGNRNSQVYNAASQVAATISPVGMRTSFTYVRGQRATTKNAVGAIATTLFDTNNRPVASIDPLGNRTTSVFNAGCVPVATVNSIGARSTSVYASGRQVATINPLGQRTSFAYNLASQRVRTQSPLGRLNTTVYNAAGQPAAAINPSGLRSTTVYDSAGRAAASIDSAGLRSTTIFDTCCSRPKATIAPNGARTSFVYNKLGSQIRTTSPTGAISTTVYDVLNRVVASIDPLGKRSTTVYDAAGRTTASVNALNQRSSTVYNVASQAIASINALGFRTTQVYDAASRGVASINPKGNRWTTVYNLASQSIASVDPLGRRSTSVYDKVGAVVASINPAGSRSTTVYNIAGQTIASVNAKGSRSTTTYNADGQTVASINALGFRSTSIYDAGGRGVAAVDAKGNRSTTVYDSKGRAAASVNPLGRRWTTIYNTVGQTVASRDPLGNRSTSVYDAAGRVVASINPLGKRATTVYNIASQSLATIDANGNRVSSVYDALGRRTVEVNALGTRTTTVYNSLGQTSALVDARANRHSFTYDATGAQTQLIDPLNRRTTSAYDAAGQQNLRIDARSNRTTYAYSTVGQLASRKYPDGSRATFSYDTVGNRTVMADSTGRYTATYDAVGQTTVTASPNSQRQTFSYDTVGQRRSMDATGAGRFTYQYDAANQISSLRNPYSERTTFGYDDAGRRNVQRNANGTRVSLSYDAASQTTQVFHRTSAGASVLQLDYQYDNAGNRKSMAENGSTARTTWTYDKQNQLLGEHRTGTNPYRQTFTYDTVGNRTLKNVDTARTTYTYDVANQLRYGQVVAGRTSFAYDATGNQRIEQPPTGNRTTTTWNYENQPTQYRLPTGSPVTMSYNGDNRRVVSQQGATSTKFVWDVTTDAYLSELNSANAVQAVYTNEPQRYGSILSQRRSSTSHWLHADALGTTRLLTSSTQTTTDSYLLDAWGNTITSSGTTVNPFRWVGRYGYYQDASTGLVYMRARLYQPTVARWLSMDPLPLADGMNNFAYAQNSPILYIDPSGNVGVCASLGYPMFTADIVAKSFINGVPTIGTLNRPANLLGIPLPLPSFVFPYDWFEHYYGPTGADAATARLNLFISGIKRSRLAAWFQNPTTSVKDGVYRLYTRAVMQFACCGDKLACVETKMTDMEGGLEFPAQFITILVIDMNGIPVPRTLQISPNIYGTINMSPVHLENRTESSVDVWWTGWGRPNRLAEPGMQAIGQRTSVNIWHSPDVQLSCVNGQGTYKVLEPQTAVSRFPSHRIWVNGGAFAWERAQKAVSDLWTPSPANPDFVVDMDGNPARPRF